MLCGYWVTLFHSGDPCDSSFPQTELRLAHFKIVRRPMQEEWRSKSREFPEFSEFFFGQVLVIVAFDHTGKKIPWSSPHFSMLDRDFLESICSDYEQISWYKLNPTWRPGSWSCLQLHIHVIEIMNCLSVLNEQDLEAACICIFVWSR